LTCDMKTHYFWNKHNQVEKKAGVLSYRFKTGYVDDLCIMFLKRSFQTKCQRRLSTHTAAGNRAAQDGRRKMKVWPWDYALCMTGVGGWVHFWQW
jgi:hypothetical protein